jgi:PAS domain S-box-containing protein
MMEPDAPATTGPAGGVRPLTDVEFDDSLVWSLIEAVPDGIVIVDSQGRIILVNQQTEELFGYDRGDLLGKPVETLLPEHLREPHRAHRTRYRAEPRVRAMGSGLELRGRRSDGREFPVEISLSPLLSGTDTFVIATVRDVTERLAVEEENRRIRHTLDATKDAVFLFDPQTLRFCYVNQGAVEQVGYRRDELLGMTPLHLNPEISERELRALLAPLIDGSVTARTVQTVHRHRSGRDVPVEMVVQYPPAREGTTRLMVALVRDVTERLETERRLREAAHELALARQELAVTEDRERIARDLHDTVIQRLFAAGMTLQGTLARLEEGPTRERIELAVTELDETIREIRSAIFGLRTPVDGGPGLRGELVRLVAEARPALGFSPRLRFAGPVESIDPAIAEQLLPSLREALANVARHASATAVRITLEVGDEVVLRVVDDGVGVSGEVVGGQGLRNLAERAALVGGTCTVGRADGGGTVVEWRAPSG